MTALLAVTDAAESGSQVPLIIEIAIVVLAGFLGFQLISKVPNTLHTPLMSGTNAIHGIVVLGGLLVIGVADGFVNDLILVIAIAATLIGIAGHLYTQGRDDGEAALLARQAADINRRTKDATEADDRARRCAADPACAGMRDSWRRD